MSVAGTLRRVFANFAILSAGELASRVLTFVAVVVLTRALGVEAFGVLTFALAAVLYAELAIGFGLDHLGQLEVARREEPVADLVSSVVTARVAIAVVAYAVLAAFVAVAPVPAGARGVTLLFGPLLLARALQVDWTLTGSERMAPVAAAHVAAEAVLAAGVILLVNDPDDLLRAPLVYCASRAALSLVVGVAALRRFGAPAVRVRFALTRRLLREAAPIAASIGCMMLFFNFDLVALGLLSGAEASGIYGAAYRLVLLLSLIVLGYLVSLRPVLGRASLEGYGTISDLVSTSLRVASVASFGVAVGGIVLARPLLALLFGEAFAEAAPILRVLLAAFALLVLDRHHLDLLVAFHHQRANLLALAAGATVNVALTLALIPAFGTLGAAVATVVAEALVLALAIALVRRRVGPVPTGLPAIRTVLCGAALAGFLWWVDGPHVLVRVALGGALYAGLVLLSGVVRPAEIRRAVGAGDDAVSPPGSADRTAD